MGVLVAIATGLLAGAWAAIVGARFELAWMSCLVVLGIGFLIAVSTRHAAVRPARRGWPFWAGLAALVGQSLAGPPPPRRDVPPGTVRLSGRVERSWHGRVPRAVLRVEEGATLDGRQSVLPGARVELSGLDAATGSRVALLARVRPVTRFDNPTPHPDWPDARPADGRGRVHGRPRLRGDAPPWHRLSHALRHALRARLRDTLSDPAAALALTMLLGESSALASEDRDAVRDAGLAHVLAVSGLHVTLLAGSIVWLVARVLVRVERLAARVEVARIAKGTGVPLALSYAALVGDAPSAWRAAVTASIAWSLGAAGRRAHPAAVTASAAVVLGALRPDDLGRPGFMLSIVATAALVSDLEQPPRTSWARAGLVLGVRTTLATAPLVLWMFGQVPLVGLLANLVVVPLAATLLLPLLATHAVFAALAPPVAHVTGSLSDSVSRAFLAACHVFSRVPLGRDLPPPDVAQGVVIGLGCLGLLVVRTWSMRALVIILGSAAILVAEINLRRREAPRGELRATFLDVGQGDAALIDLPDGRLMMVDTGGAAMGGPDPGAHVIAPLLRARRRWRIDVLVLSHPHPDHYGGLEAVLEAASVGEVWDTGQAERETPAGPVMQMLRQLQARGARLVRPPELCAKPRDFGAVRARVLWPCPEYDPGWGANDNSLVIELRYGRRRLLLTGDAEAHAEAGLLRRGLRSVDVLKVGHHGSRTSTGAALLDRLRPRIAVVSAGRANPFGHPHTEVWRRLTNRVEGAFRTDLDGAVTVRTDGDRLLVHSARAGRRELAPAKESLGFPEKAR